MLINLQETSNSHRCTSQEPNGVCRAVNFRGSESWLSSSHLRRQFGLTSHRKSPNTERHRWLKLFFLIITDMLFVAFGADTTWHCDIKAARGIMIVLVERRKNQIPWWMKAAVLGGKSNLSMLIMSKFSTSKILTELSAWQTVASRVPLKLQQTWEKASERRNRIWRRGVEWCECWRSISQISNEIGRSDDSRPLSSW